jgi:hypothetical protein
VKGTAVRIWLGLRQRDLLGHRQVVAVAGKHRVRLLVDDEDEVRAGIVLGVSLPFSGKVILVPFFHPGFMSIVRISSTGIVFLHTHTERERR